MKAVFENLSASTKFSLGQNVPKLNKPKLILKTEDLSLFVSCELDEINEI